jgi:hypothetical protein
VKNFLRIALDGGYHSGKLTRAANGGAWATVNPRWKNEWSKKLALDRVLAAPEAKPVDGDIVLVREGDDWFGFAVFLGDRIDLGKAEVIPIGRVTAGRDVIGKILDSLASGGEPARMVEIRRVIRNE